MRILIDVGNSRLKWAAVEGEVYRNGEPLEHRHKKFAQELHKAWQSVSKAPGLLCISCVGKTDLLALIIDVAEQLWPGVEVFIPTVSKQFLEVKNGYRQPEKLGVDRWLGLIAARQRTQLPACVVDCGTAITIDFLDASGQHAGGIISPGLTLMKQALADGTEQLTFSGKQSVIGLANHTRAAIYSGTFYAAVGLIEKVFSTQDRRGTKVFLTGGDAEIIAAELRMETIYEPELVLHGLWAVSNAVVN